MMYNALRVGFHLKGLSEHPCMSCVTTTQRTNQPEHWLMCARVGVFIAVVTDGNSFVIRLIIEFALNS